MHRTKDRVISLTTYDDVEITLQLFIFINRRGGEYLTSVIVTWVVTITR